MSYVAVDCTDSLCYHIKHDDIYDVMKRNLHLFDTSDFPQNDPRGLYSSVNIKRVGCFKDELSGRAAYEFCGLRAKMYSLLVNNNDSKPKMTAKGVKRSYVKHHLTHNMYYHTLFSHESSEASFAAIRSKNHQLQTVQLRKTCLSAFDDKRFILADGVSSLAYGHCLIGSPNYK